MNGHGLKQSLGHWAERLFNQAKAAPALQPKTYFAHRHQDNQAATESPFRALFGSGTNEHPPELAPDSMMPPVIKDELPRAAAPNTSFTVLNGYAETQDTKTFRLGRHNAPPFDYLPGQFVTLAVEIAGQTYKRSYSLASTPSHPGILEITVKRDPSGGLVSNWLNDHLITGDTVNLKGPFGKFSCGKSPSHKLLLLAAGSGILPIMSMLRWLSDTEACVDVVLLLLSFRTPADIIYGHELKLLAAQHQNIHLTITLTTDVVAGYPWSGLTGRVDEPMLMACVPDLPERTVYLCGPVAFMAECKKNLLKLGLPAEQLCCESFAVNSQNVSLTQPLKSSTGHYQIRFAKSGKSIAADGGMTLLALAEQNGIAIRHECRRGSCGECMVKCLKGQVAMTEQAEIGALDKNQGWVYTCCAYPASNVELDL